MIQQAPKPSEQPLVASDREDARDAARGVKLGRRFSKTRVAWGVSVFVLFCGAVLYWNAELRVPSGTPLPALRVREEVVKLIPPAEGFSFAVLGDYGNCEAAPRLAVLKDAQSRGNLFLCHVGDFVAFANPAKWKRYIRELAANLKPGLPFFHTPGNHDVDRNTIGTSYAFYSHYFGRFWYAVDVGRWRLIGLDSSRLYIPEEQRQWLARQLDDAKRLGQRTIIWTHVPPRPIAGRSDSLTLKRETCEALARILSGYDVAAIFAGHIHENFSYVWHGIPVYLTALDDNAWTPGPAMYYEVTVRGNTLDVQTIRIPPPR